MAIQASNTTQIGMMRQRVTINGYEKTADGIGGVTSVPVQVAVVWADIKPISARQRMLMESPNQVTTHTATFRHDAVLDLNQFDFELTYNGRRFQIEYVINNNERGYLKSVGLKEVLK